MHTWGRGIAFSVPAAGHAEDGTDLVIREAHKPRPWTTDLSLLHVALSTSIALRTPQCEWRLLDVSERWCSETRC
jgi:hypothetical protein